MTKCTYPDCDCAVSFPRGHHPSEATQCPRSDSIHVQLTPGEYSFDSGKTWVHSFFEALKRAFAPGDPYGIGAGGDPGPHSIEEARLMAGDYPEPRFPTGYFYSGAWHKEPPS